MRRRCAGLNTRVDLMQRDSGTALVLFSGGQDSTTWALENFERVETIGFAYGQQHRIELDVRPYLLGRIRKDFPAWGGRLGEDHMIDMTVLGQISDTALTRDAEFAVNANGLANTFVPGRNLLFLSFAAAIAYRIGAKTPRDRRVRDIISATGLSR